MARYASPFGGDGYDVPLSATHSFLAQYMRYMELAQEARDSEINRQHTKSLISLHRAQERHLDQEPRDTTRPFSPSELEKVYEGMGNFPDANAIYNPTGSEVRRRQLEAMPRGEEGPGWSKRALGFLGKKTPPGTAGKVWGATRKYGPLGGGYAALKSLWSEEGSTDKSMREMGLAAEEWAGGGGTKTLDLAKSGAGDKPLIPTGPAGQYELGQTIVKGGQRYKIVGFDEDGEPLVEAY